MARTKNQVALVPDVAAQAPVATLPDVAAQPPALHGGIALATLPKHIVRMGAGLGKLSAALAPVAVVAGKPPKGLRAHQCVAWWASVADLLATGPATYTALAGANVPAHFVRYCVRSGWLVVA